MQMAIMLSLNLLCRGLIRESLLVLKPTNKKLTITGVGYDKVVDGKIVEHGGATNTFDTFLKTI